MKSGKIFRCFAFANSSHYCDISYVTYGSRVSRAPPHNTLPAFLKRHGTKWRFYIGNSKDIPLNSIDFSQVYQATKDLISPKSVWLFIVKLFIRFFNHLSGKWKAWRYLFFNSICTDKREIHNRYFGSKKSEKNGRLWTLWSLY